MPVRAPGRPDVLTDPPSQVSKAALHGGTTTLIDFVQCVHDRTIQQSIEQTQAHVEGRLLLRLRLPSHADGRGADAAFRPARRCDAGRPCQHQDLHHQHPAGQPRPHGAARPHLGGAEGRRGGGRHRLHPCRGQRHRHVHVREADAREPRQLRAHGRGAQHAVGGALLQPRDPAGRECRGRGALHGACLGGDRRGGARGVARAAASRCTARPCTSTCCTTPRTTSGRAGRCSTPTRRSNIPRTRSALWEATNRGAIQVDRHRRAVLPAAGQAAGQPDRRHDRRQLRRRAAASG